MAIYCTYCGKQISDKARFCRYCGKKVDEDIEPVRVSDEPAPVYPVIEPVVPEQIIIKQEDFEPEPIHIEPVKPEQIHIETEEPETELVSSANDDTMVLDQFFDMYDSVPKERTAPDSKSVMISRATDGAVALDQFFDMYDAAPDEPVEPGPIGYVPFIDDTEVIGSFFEMKDTVSDSSAATEPVQTEPVITEPINDEPVEPELVVPEHAHTDPAEPEPIGYVPFTDDTEIIGSFFKRQDTVSDSAAVTEPGQTEPMITEPIYIEPAEPEHVEFEPIHIELTEPEPANYVPLTDTTVVLDPFYETNDTASDTPTVIESMQAVSRVPEPVHIESVIPEPAHVEPVKLAQAEFKPVRIDMVDPEVADYVPDTTKQMYIDPSFDIGDSVNNELTVKEPTIEGPMITDARILDTLVLEPFIRNSSDNKPAKAEPANPRPVYTDTAMPDPVNTGEVSYGLVDDNPVRVNTAKIEAVPSETGRLGGYSEQYNSYSYYDYDNDEYGGGMSTKMVAFIAALAGIVVTCLAIGIFMWIS